MRVEPLYDRVIIEPIVEKSSLIETPDTVDERQFVRSGIVIEVGPGHMLPDGGVRPLTVKRGDKVLLGQFPPSNAQLIDGKDCFIIRENEIMGIFRKEEIIKVVKE